MEKTDMNKYGFDGTVTYTEVVDSVKNCEWPLVRDGRDAVLNDLWFEIDARNDEIAKCHRKIKKLKTEKKKAKKCKNKDSAKKKQLKRKIRKLEGKLFVLECEQRVAFALYEAEADRRTMALIALMQFDEPRNRILQQCGKSMAEFVRQVCEKGTYKYIEGKDLIGEVV